MLSRRTALKGGTAVACAAAITATAASGAAALAALQDDAALFELAASFHRTYQTSLEAKEQFLRARRGVEALPGCPSLADYEAWQALMEKHGEHALYQEWCSLSERYGKLVLAIFETSATTLLGAIEKLRIVHLAIGDGEGSLTADSDLKAYQDLDAPWMESVIRDLEHPTAEGVS